MKYKIKYEKLPTQALVFNDDTTDILMQSMGLGGGKTYNLCMKLLKLSQLNKGKAGGVLAPSFPDFKKDILPTFQDILESNRIKFKYHQTDKYFLFPWSKAPLYVFTAEKPIAGPNLAYGGVNEFSLIQYQRITEFMRRIRVKAPFKQTVMVGTPEDTYGWLEEFIEQQEKRDLGKFKIHYGSTSENTHIDDEYTQLLESMLDEASLEIFRDGKIGRIGGNYFYYAFDKKKNVTDEAQYNSELVIHASLDFNVGNMACGLSHRIGNEQHFFDEIHLKGDSNTYTMAKRLKALYPVHQVLITCDASGNSRTSKSREQKLTDVKILRDEGFEVRFKAQNTRLRKRQILMNGLFAHQRIKLNPICKQLIKDFAKVKQKMDFTKDEGPNKEFSHFSDGADYLCDFEFPLDLNRKPSRMIQL